MIARTVLSRIEEKMSYRPVTLITGARQTGKTTLCRFLSEKYGMGYVSLANMLERRAAVKDPELFLKTHPAPLVIDEVQYAPGLFDYLEGIVDKVKFEGGKYRGMYVLAGSQEFSRMQGVSQSMAGRIGIIRLSPLSQSEIAGREDIPFRVEPELNDRRAEGLHMTCDEFYNRLVRGSYPELYNNPSVDTGDFYSDYTETYISRDVSQIINVKDSLKFQEFLELTASLTGQELVYENISNAIGIDAKTVKSWLGVLETSGIIRVLRSYTSRSPVKRVIRRPKIYFCDTGLACYLAKVVDAETLKNGYLCGPMVETYIVNEIIKSHENNGVNTGFSYYRDQSGEIDLVMLRDGKLTLVECKSGITYDAKDVKSFERMDRSLYEIGPSCIICLTEKMYALKENVYALPFTSI